MRDLLTFTTLAAIMDASDTQLDQLRGMIVSRANGRLISTLGYLVSNTNKKSLGRRLSALSEDCKDALDLPSTIRRRGPGLAPFTKVEDSGKVVMSEKSRLGNLNDDDDLLRLGLKGVAGW